MGNGHQTDHKEKDKHVDSMTGPAQRVESVKILLLAWQIRGNNVPLKNMTLKMM